MCGGFGGRKWIDDTQIRLKRKKHLFHEICLGFVLLFFFFL